MPRNLCPLPPPRKRDVLNGSSLKQFSLIERFPVQKKIDAVGSLDHTSPLSISLASSEGLSEIKNLALVVQSGGNSNLNNNNHELDSNLPTPTSGVPPPPLDNNNAAAMGLMIAAGRPPLPPSTSGGLQSNDHSNIIPGPSQRLWTVLVSPPATVFCLVSFPAYSLTLIHMRTCPGEKYRFLLFVILLNWLLRWNQNL